MTEHGRAIHTDLNADAAPMPTMSDRERLEAIQFCNRDRQPWQQADLLVIHLEELLELAFEALDARAERAVELVQVDPKDAGCSFPCFAERGD